MSDKRQKNRLQMLLAFTEEGRSEAPRAPREGIESLTANGETENPAGREQWMEEVCGRENLKQALRRVKANKGSPGIDDRKVSDLSGYLKQHWPAIREQLLSGTYQPQPVRRVEIAKPDGALDCNIYVASERAGNRVLRSVTSFIQRRLKLKVNATKSAVARPQERKFLGFSFTYGTEPKRRIAPKALLRCKQRVRELTRRTQGISLEQMTKALASYLRGWKGYFGYCETPSVLRKLEAWMRRRLRSMIWKQ